MACLAEAEASILAILMSRICLVSRKNNPTLYFTSAFQFIIFPRNTIIVWFARFVLGIVTISYNASDVSSLASMMKTTCYLLKSW